MRTAHECLLAIKEAMAGRVGPMDDRDRLRILQACNEGLKDSEPAKPRKYLLQFPHGSQPPIGELCALARQVQDWIEKPGDNVLVMTDGAELVPFDAESTEVVAKRTQLRVGRLAVDLNAAGFGAVFVDGKEIACTGLRVDLKAGHAPNISLDLAPITHNYETGEPVPPRPLREITTTEQYVLDTITRSIRMALPKWAEELDTGNGKKLMLHHYVPNDMRIRGRKFPADGLRVVVELFPDRIREQHYPPETDGDSPLLQSFISPDKAEPPPTLRGILEAAEKIKEIENSHRIPPPPAGRVSYPGDPLKHSASAANIAELAMPRVTPVASEDGLDRVKVKYAGDGCEHIYRKRDWDKVAPWIGKAPLSFIDIAKNKIDTNTEFFIAENQERYRNAVAYLTEPASPLCKTLSWLDSKPGSFFGTPSAAEIAKMRDQIEKSFGIPQPAVCPLVNPNAPTVPLEPQPNGGIPIPEEIAQPLLAAHAAGEPIRLDDRPTPTERLQALIARVEQAVEAEHKALADESQPDQKVNFREFL